MTSRLASRVQGRNQCCLNGKLRAAPQAQGVGDDLNAPLILAVDNEAAVSEQWRPWRQLHGKHGLHALTARLWSGGSQNGGRLHGGCRRASNQRRQRQVGGPSPPWRQARWARPQIRAFARTSPAQFMRSKVARQLRTGRSCCAAKAAVRPGGRARARHRKHGAGQKNSSSQATWTSGTSGSLASKAPCTLNISRSCAWTHSSVPRGVPRMRRPPSAAGRAWSPTQTWAPSSTGGSPCGGAPPAFHIHVLSGLRQMCARSKRWCSKRPKTCETREDGEATYRSSRKARTRSSRCISLLRAIRAGMMPSTKKAGFSNAFTTTSTAKSKVIGATVVLSNVVLA